MDLPTGDRDLAGFSFPPRMNFVEKENTKNPASNEGPLPPQALSRSLSSDKPAADPQDICPYRPPNRLNFVDRIIGGAEKLATRYFKLFPWEKIGDGKIYEHLGIRTFKKYLPTTGDLMTRYFWKPILGEGMIEAGGTRQTSRARDALELHYRRTYTYESIHLAFLLFSAPQISTFFFRGDIKGGLILTGLQALVNLYPIMLQRYNRARLDRVLEKIQTPPERTRSPQLEPEENANAAASPGKPLAL
ncbi:MAG: hypothetical protein KDD64_04000 [Bdellovibrionales bacterium]|nr:hypothetical protein [Bdellovibrionales bacterium]